MFLKIKQEGSSNITKIKFENQSLQEIKAAVSKKLNLTEGLELYYLDEDKDKVQLNDDDDWKICLESTADLSQSAMGSGVQNVTLIVNTIPGTQALHLISAPMKQEPLMSAPAPQNQYPSPPVDQQMAGYFSTLFGGMQPNSEKNSAVHPHIVCDGCLMQPLVGVRYKSVSTNDFDLCETCALSTKYRNQTFIRIPYYNEHENKNLYDVNSYPKLISIFTKNLREPVSEEVKQMVSMLKNAFLSTDSSVLNDLVKKNPGKSYAELYTLHVKSFHS